MEPQNDPHPSGPAAPPPRIALLACAVFEREIEQLACAKDHIVVTRMYEIALHDRPDQMRLVLQKEIDELGERDDIDAIVLGYGLCGLGTAGLTAGKHRLVFPRAHDCITVFMGSKERFAEHQSACPTCYYYTPGWNRARRVPGPQYVEILRENLLARFDEEDVDYLIEQERRQWTLRDTATYLSLDTDDAESEAEFARECAAWLGWRLQRLKGDDSLLRDLIAGNWDDAERFQVIEPGSRLAHSPDANVMRREDSP